VSTKEAKAIKTKRYLTPALIFGLLIPVTSVITATTSCNPDMPRKLLPAYYLNIQFPIDEEDISTLTIKPGDSATLPVTVTSNSEIPISIRLIQDDQRTLPETIAFESGHKYVTLQPGESITLYVTFTVSEFATPGKYNTGIHGELKEPVEDRALMTQRYNLVVTDS